MIIIMLIERRKNPLFTLLHLNKLESPSLKDALCQVWLKLAQLVKRRRFLNFVNVFLLFGNYFPIISPLGRAWPFIWTILNPLHPGKLCAKFGWNWPSGSGGEDENVKSLQTDRWTDGRTDGQTDGRQVIRKAHMSFQLRELKNSFFFQLTDH